MDIEVGRWELGVERWTLGVERLAQFTQSLLAGAGGGRTLSELGVCLLR